MSRTVPLAGGVLALVGSLFVLLAGTILAGFGGFLLFVPFGFLLSGLFFVGLVIGILLLIFSVLILVAPSMKNALGAVVIVLAVLSVPFALGGFLIGFLLTLIGGILTVLHTDPPPVLAWGFPVGAWACPACGGVVDPSRRICTRCGRAS